MTKEVAGNDLTAKKRKLKSKFTAYWKAKDKERIAKDEAKALEAEILEITKEFPMNAWDGGTLRNGADCVRRYSEDKLNYPSKFDKDAFVASNQEYAITTSKVNESLILERIQAGNKYLQSFGFVKAQKSTIRLERS
ncbi:hypothetical protein [uncultured Microscilla sp.]|uniref:hypothetical protein n=1 Tax=uncultured Microscilla sp. TaxID=432653 RepID=UPI002636B846|nr:hypothetical protein [uncultured Microscilla sp.]